MSSGQPPNQPPYAPFQPSAIHYDETGNPYFEDASGRRFAYYGQFPTPGAAVPVVPAIPHDNMRDGPNELLPPIFQASAAAGPSSAGNFAIDPALQTPLPDTNDDDLSDGPTIAKARGYLAAVKVAGARRKGKERAVPEKGKGKAHTAPETSRKRKRPVSDDEDDDDNAKRGRPRGAGNYTSEDVSALLDFVEKELPLGQRGWQSIHRSFTRWSRNNGRPARGIKSLETKFKQLVKVKKPTGDAYCPPEVKRAHCIDGLINERASTRDISDSELDGDEGDAATGGDEDEDEDSGMEAKAVERKKAPHNAIREAIVRRPEAPVQPRAPRNTGAELMSKLSSAFDPSVQQARDAERASRSLQNAQFLTLSQQLRDATSVAETLRSQIYTLQSRVHEAERARDRAELKLEMAQLSHAPPNLRHRHRPHYRRRSPATKKSLVRVNGKTRVDEHFPEGGSHTYWVTDPSSDESLDSNKENHPPLYRYPSPYPSHRRPVSPFCGYPQERLASNNGSNDSGIIMPPAPRFHSAASNLNNMLIRPESPFQASAPSNMEDMEGFDVMGNTSTEGDKECDGQNNDG